MSEPKFTPGPYFISGNAIGPRIDSDDQSDGMVYPVARIDRYDWPENWKFNAHLFAAAPELYGVLEYVRDILGPHDGWADDSKRMIDAALKKARGAGREP